MRRDCITRYLRRALGEKYILDSYAVTPNGLKMYGEVRNVNYEDGLSIIRLLVKDDLGNKYLMYPRTRKDDKKDAEDVWKVEYELYRGTATTGTDYRMTWASGIKKLTVVFQEDASENWDDFSIISDEFVIDLEKDAEKGK